MARSPDKTAVYDPRTETVRTGTGHHLRLRDLHAELMTLSPYNLRRIVGYAGLGGMTDPMEVGQAEAVREIIDLVRGMPQYALPIVQAAADLPAGGDGFAELLRDRAFGRAAGPRAPEVAAGALAAPRAATQWSDKVGRFFWDSRREAGEFSYFIRSDHKILTVRGDQRLSTRRPYQECFLVIRTAHGRYYLRWPSEAPHEPAWYVDREGQRHAFFPVDEDFEELFPGYTYEAFALQFALPDIGTDYRRWLDDVPDDTPVLPEEDPVPAGGGSPRLIADLLDILEAGDRDIRTVKELSRHFRVLSNRYHPLKHLHASADEKERINARYLEITNAYNSLKKLLDPG